MQNTTLNIDGKLLVLDSPIVMGIINVTPDSFAVACRSMSAQEILTSAESAVANGATILDVGAYSTRPGAEDVSEEEEWRRLSLALGVIRERFPDVIISVDTFRSTIARKAVEQYSVGIINDISGGELDPLMFETVAQLHVPYILMHMRGDCRTMNTLTDYSDLMSEMMQYFSYKLDKLHQLGVCDVIIDPGFGFAKTVEQNYEILRRLGELQELNAPILAGLSRKSMLYKVLGTNPTDSRTLNATSVANLLALEQGAAILRVHDVRECADVIQLYKHIYCSSK